MATWKKIALSVLGALWAFFLVAITLTPHDAWDHVLAWWGAILAGLVLVGAALAAIWKSFSILILWQAHAAALRELFVFIRRRKSRQKSRTY